MNKSSNSKIFRNKIKQAATKKEKNNVVVIFKTPEEEKKFSEIAKRVNYGLSLDNKPIER